MKYLILLALLVCSCGTYTTTDFETTKHKYTYRKVGYIGQQALWIDEAILDDTSDICYSTIRKLPYYTEEQTIVVSKKDTCIVEKESNK